MTKQLARLVERYPDKPPRVLTIDLLFEPRDCWVGVYWTVLPKQIDGPYYGTGRKRYGVWSGIDLYVTLVPMLPLRVQWRRHRMMGDVERLGIEFPWEAA